MLDDKQREDMVFEGDRRRESGDLDGAIAIYSEFLNDVEITGSMGPMPDWVTNTYYNVADCYERQGKLDKAVEALEKALAIKPDEADFLFNYGMFCGRIGKHAEAVGAFRRFLKVEPNAREIEKVKILLQNSQRMVAEGKSDADAKDEDSDSKVSRLNAGIQFLNGGAQDRAIEVFEGLLKEPSLPLNIQLLCHHHISRAILQGTGGRNLEQCIGKLTKEQESIIGDRHAAAVMAIKDKLSPEQLSHEPIDEAWKFADSLILAIAGQSMRREVEEEKPEQETRENKKDHKCFIATACLGSASAEEVVILSSFRDEVLVKNIIGRGFIATYYALSPPIAKIIAGHRSLQILTRAFVVRPVAKAIRKF